MKKLFIKLTNWVLKTFFSRHYVRTYGAERLEYQVAGEAK